ncbi:MAG: TIGR03086 family metal-binding protein [Mycobacterium sp.]
MPPDLRPGPDSRPTDELASAEDTLGVLQHVLHTVAGDDMSRQTPCTQFTVAQLTEHLLNSITAIGGMAGAEIPAADEGDSAEQRVVSAARPALDAWHRRGLEGSVPFGKGEMPAKGACGILSLEFLVHAWDYARAVGHDIEAPEPLAEYVLGLARVTIQPELRSRAGFDDPVAVAEDAGALDRLVGFTGRNPRPA